MAGQTVKIRPVTLYRGVSEAARRAGVSQSHLSRVLRGERKAGPELERRLRRMGVRICRAREEGIGRKEQG